MITKEFFGFIIDCDKCSNFLNCDTYEDFRGAIDMAKDEGWKITKDEEGDWIHLCPICAEKRDVKK